MILTEVRIRRGSKEDLQMTRSGDGGKDVFESIEACRTNMQLPWLLVSVCLCPTTLAYIYPSLLPSSLTSCSDFLCFCSFIQSDHRN